MGWRRTLAVAITLSAALVNGVAAETGVATVLEGALQAEVANPMVHARGTRIVDGSGEELKLRGVLLEGWLMWNGTLWGAGLSSETKVQQRLEKMVGAARAAEFRTAIYDHFITERDIEMIAGLGLNMVRVPLNHTVLEGPEGNIDPAAPGWQYLDRLITWCERKDVYVVLDLHAVPGGQSGVFVSDPDAVLVWDSERDQERTIDLWKAIAQRYRDKKIVAGYDLVNEPEPPNHTALISLYRRIIEAIRSVDPHHMVILEGGGIASSDFSFFEEALDPNQAYGFHTYNFVSNDLGEGHLEELAEMAEKQQVPLWNGEFGAHTEDWVRQQIALFEDPRYHVNGWTFWPWKRVPEAGWASKRFRHFMEIRTSKAWDTVRKYLGSLFGLKKIPQSVSEEALRSFVEAIQAENLEVAEGMTEVLQSWRNRKSGSDVPEK